MNASSEKGVDYDKLIDKFGCTRFTKEDCERMEKITGERAHQFFRRGIIFCHRDFTSMLDRYEKGELFYLYTGRGPSSEAMHLGHAVPFVLNSFLQKIFDIPIVIQVTDDEKFLYRPEYDLETI